jgi:membrane-bound acyltransferase YfiQ involved in biofilm formation
LVKEVFFLRSIACLCVALYNVIGVSVGQFSRVTGLGQTEGTAWLSIYTLVLFATPMFIFISQFSLSLSSSHPIKRDFLSKRVKYILLPYISMGIFYGFISGLNHGSAMVFLERTWKNIFLGGFHGYFILIIFQFYFLHLVFHRIADRFKPGTVLAASFVVNAAYLLLAGLYWYHPNEAISLWWYPFTGWIFYFSLAYYCGRYYDKLKAWLKRYQAGIAAGAFLSAASVLYIATSQIIALPPGSKRVDNLIYTAFMILFMLWIASRVNSMPRIFVDISRYSFGIYLLNPFVLMCYSKLFERYIPPLANVSLYVALLFPLAVATSMAATYVITRLPFGQYVVGKVGAAPQGGRYSAVQTAPRTS